MKKQIICACGKQLFPQTKKYLVYDKKNKQNNYRFSICKKCGNKIIVEKNIILLFSEDLNNLRNEILNIL